MWITAHYSGFKGNSFHYLFKRSLLSISLGRLSCHVNIPTRSVPLGLSQQGQVSAMSTCQSLPKGTKKQLTSTRNRAKYTSMYPVFKSANMLNMRIYQQLPECKSWMLEFPFLKLKLNIQACAQVHIILSEFEDFLSIKLKFVKWKVLRFILFNILMIILVF